MRFEMQCPRCGREFAGNDRDQVADEVLEHAQGEHHHRLDRDVVLAHLAGVNPHDFEPGAE
jgi:hypothetical protein